MMATRYQDKDIEGAKTQILRHIADYIKMIVGDEAEGGSAIAELFNYFDSFREILVVSEKKNIPIVFKNNKDTYNLLGINERYAYFIKMSSEVHELQEIETNEYEVKWVPEEIKLNWAERIFHAYFGYTPRINYNGIKVYKKKRIISNGRTYEFKATEYWFRNNYEEVMEFIGEKPEPIIMKDYVTYRLVPGQQESGFAVEMFNNPFNLESNFIGNREGFNCYAIKLSDLGLGALYTVSELIAKERLTERTISNYGDGMPGEN